jgi:DNA-binding transcriptional LysR family regulator
MELRHLRCFLAVAEELHFGRAAERLHISQPPLSQHIQNLEAELGVSLFMRTKRRVELTDAGRVLVGHAERVIEAAAAAARATQRAGTGAIGRLAVGFLHAHAYELLPRIVSSFRDGHPDVELRLEEQSSSQQLAAISARHLDFGLVWLPVGSGDVASARLGAETYVIAVPAGSRLAALPAIHVRELAEEPIVMFARQPGNVGLFRSVSNIFFDARISPPVAQSANTIHTAIGLVSAGVGIAIVPQSARRLGFPTVEFRPILGGSWAIDYGLAWRSGRLTPVQEAFRETALAIAAEVAKSETGE